ncbi:MAG: universal stress protein [Alphaproteobacteria bacterium]|nr:MAG: universal stress protein [Alphaproteobacteria bacterium]
MIVDIQREQAPKNDGAEHLWKFMVVVDETPEFRRALRFAALRAARIKGGVVLLNIIPPADFQHWMAVENLMREEARQEMQPFLDELVAEVRALAGITPEVVVREGKPQDEILAQIEEDPDIHVLVLGAASEENPGPLVSAFSGPMLRKIHIPVLFVPGSLTDEEIDRLI